ncbi:hypothetical protein SADUNF_Sadunf03G0107700 [Salix dunnii]|uniref:Cellulose synthase-like protein G3 n=1 Tax=Salix dunnii TaxID=1413687 RepID=A0A835KF35_9ROSI|nr:hypothetical protein SADUNF_Sadunf03G0107700 [Salix dunnii]
MKGSFVSGASTDDAPLLHTVTPLRRTIFNRVFAAIYALAILTLLYYHARTLIYSATLVSFSATLALLFSDLVLAFMWVTTQTFRMCPVYRNQFPENVEKILKRSDFPALDVFVCTADPYKEPPIGVVNTALAAMAYDYPAEKISVYISDDGGSALTLFAFMEAAKFATHWLPFCKKNNILERSPEAYFGSNHPCTSESEKIKMMYESMKVKVEHVLERGTVGDQYITSDQEREAFNQWSSDFTRQDHPAVIQVLLDASRDKDIDGYLMPNLIYISREKNKSSPHHFKAGALNALLRVSGCMTNAPILLALDCDFRSNDPQTPLRVLCYLCDPAIPPNLGFVQFPQLFQGINKSDIYNAEYKRLFQINMLGFDGSSGPNYIGTGCFFRRRSLFGCPTSLISPEIPELAPDHVVGKPIQSQSVLSLAHRIGFRYGSLVEDYYTGFRMHCEGWKSVYCNPERPAFFGDVPTNFIDALNQQKRWAVGLLEVAFSKYSPATHGVRTMGPLMGLGYAQAAFWPIWSIPITTYAFLPQLALLNKVYIFPKVSEPWFFLYAFLFLGAYGQDYLDFMLAGGSVQRWWSDQRFWIARGITSYFFGSIEFFLGCLGISASGFTVTSKAVDAEQSKRYDQGIFEFGVHSPMFVSLTLAAIINLISFSQGLVDVLRGNNLEGLFVQMFISGFAVVNSLPIYEAMALRNDSGKMPIKTTITATLLAGAVYAASSFIFMVFTDLSGFTQTRNHTGDIAPTRSMGARPQGGSAIQVTSIGGHPSLHTVKPLARTLFNRVFATIYALSILALLFYHAKTLFYSTTLVSFSVTLALLISDLVLTFFWVSTQTFRMFPVCRKQFPENLTKIMERSDFPALDVFICTADPYKEPPIGVVNTALSVMAYDYPTEKISVYVSDDGGSALTLFAFMEASKFATQWLPFCKKNNVLERSPEAYFELNRTCTSEAVNIKKIYESMKLKVEQVLERGKVDDEYISSDQEREAFNKWTHNFTRQDHPAVLLDASKDKDIAGYSMPNLIYVSREKSKASSHHFKAGALNALLRVSGSMTNAPIILTLDCDSFSNDPETPLRAMCYLCDPATRPQLAYVQFPQIFRGINNSDIYNAEFKRLYRINVMGFDGLSGPNYLGTGCFFQRRAFYGSPTSLASPEIPELAPDYIVDKPVQSQSVLAIAHQVAGCNYESQSNWGSKIGFRYGSLSEDYHTGFRMQCEGWKSIFCDPDRPAFLGDVPITLNDALNQQKRWSIGLLEVGFSKYSPATFGVKALGLSMGLAYAQSAFWAMWSIPITAYAFLPQLALLNKVYIFPKASEPWFFLYAFLFLGAYGQDFLDFILAGGSVQRWWSDQRFWIIRGISSYVFGSVEFFLKFLGISAFGFNVTSKVVDDEQSKRYGQGIFEFGEDSPMFVTLTVAAIINLSSLAQGLAEVFKGNSLDGLFVQMFISGFAVLNSWPIYEAIALRKDKGKMPLKTSIIATLLAGTLYTASCFIFRIKGFEKKNRKERKRYEEEAKKSRKKGFMNS